MSGNRKLDMKAEFEKLNPTEQHFVRKAELVNRARALSQKSLRKRNITVAGAIFAGVLSIYAYTIIAVKQEKFLDDYDDMHKK
ncbi:hypothetical protein EB796_005699 [Bugula neritina]|uniref:Cytochrome c oxidase assembly factor 3 n=1 Tax=Bugula neritina TaxID=10212 RepID=A0A7J7KDH8_BUGNE|nr:hypothetical protein EB796_005699 [Bugula neritina]